MTKLFSYFVSFGLSKYMPIEKMFKTRHISEEAFRKIDFQIMGFTFEIQNEMGRFWNEKIYQNEPACRCQKAGFHKVETEVPIIFLSYLASAIGLPRGRKMKELMTP